MTFNSIQFVFLYPIEPPSLDASYAGASPFEEYGPERLRSPQTRIKHINQRDLRRRKLVAIARHN